MNTFYKGTVLAIVVLLNLHANAMAKPETHKKVIGNGPVFLHINNQANKGYTLYAKGKNFNDLNSKGEQIAVIPAGITTTIAGITTHTSMMPGEQISDRFSLQDPATNQLINIGQVSALGLGREGDARFTFYSEIADEKSDWVVTIPAKDNLKTPSFIINMKLYEKDGQLKAIVDVGAGIGQ